MVMPGHSLYHCLEHGEQTARGCIIECPVCAHIEFLERYAPEDVESFKKNWRGTSYDEPYVGWNFE